MKLYTEKQLEESFAIGIKYAAANRPASLDEHRKYVENMIQSLTPIELPSEKDVIEELQDIGSLDYKLGKSRGIIWVLEQIKQQAE